MLDFNSILVFSENPKKLSNFYSKVLEKDPDWEDGGYYGFSAGKTILTIGPHDKVKGKNTNPERIMQILFSYIPYLTVFSNIFIQ